MSERRFVVQQHTLSEGQVHFDLMIEDGDALVTFQLEAPPANGVSGRRSFDHRKRYLDYEGEVSQGRGAVAIWDRGTVDDLAGDPRACRYQTTLRGQRLQGSLTLQGGTEEGSAVLLELE